MSVIQYVHKVRNGPFLGSPKGLVAALMSEDKLQARNPALGELEQALTRVPGVERARIVGAEEPKEIHVVAVGRKPTRSFVRDIEAIATAQFGFEIDHRIVSIVQVDRAVPPPSVTQGRPSIERVSMSRQNNADWVEVTLRWPTGETTTGTGAAGTSRDARARGATAATVTCLDPKLNERKATLEVEHVTLHSVSTSAEWVLVHTTLYEESASTPLLGSARVVDDIATASVRAVLNAVSRKLLPA